MIIFLILFFSFSIQAEKCLNVGDKHFVSGVPGPKGWVLPKKCCQGLVDRELLSVCGKGLTGGYQYICLKCGDGKCDKSLESKCNCPEDCRMMSLPPSKTPRIN